MQVSAERKQNGGNKSLGERQLDGKSSKKRQKTASLSRPVSFGCAYCHTLLTRQIICSDDDIGFQCR